MPNDRFSQVTSARPAWRISVGKAALVRKQSNRLDQVLVGLRLTGHGCAEARDDPARVQVIKRRQPGGRGARTPGRQSARRV
jgi:hypothetical protein